VTAGPKHFPGCHPEDARSDDEADTATAGQLVQACWHCGTLTPRGCSCLECQDGADYVPTSAVYHCPACKRWWAWMLPRITTITFGADPDKPEEG
jgi:hypothetical protein